MGTTHDDIDKFITAVHGANSVRALDQKIFIPVGIIMHVKVLCFELYDRNKWNSLPDAATLADIDKAQLILTKDTRNQYARDTERLKNTSVPELTVSKFTTSKFESFMDKFKLSVSHMDGIHGFPLITFSQRLQVNIMITGQLGGKN